MENWGLITYREKYILYDSTIYSLKDRQRVTDIVAHELAHMVNNVVDIIISNISSGLAIL
jgi:hypothetical protein